MNRRMIAYVLGRILLAEAAMMILPLMVGVIYREDSLHLFLLPMLLLLATGLLLGLKKPLSTVIYAREGFFIVAAAWILLSVFGALPFYLTGQFASGWDCIFEIVSGFTTTGASIVAEPQALPHSILFWRSFSHWVGGMGVLVFVLAIVPLSDDRSLYLMRAEVPGPVVGKLVPRMRETALILYAVYTAMTVILVILLLFGGMPLFDALCYAFGTAGTGGFSIHSEGVMLYQSAYIEIVIAIFMLLFGVNFNLYYLILIGRAKEALKSEELRVYAAIVAFATLTIAASIYGIYQSTADSLRYAFFQVSTIITTTGFATADFELWPQYCRHLMLILMLIGACAGSTGGGIKVSRLILLVKTAKQELRRLIHPRMVTVVRLEGKPVDGSLMHTTLAYFVMYILIVCVSTLLLSIGGTDITTNLSAELACFNNIGPGLGLVGPMSNYNVYSSPEKMLLTLNMLFGRLEIFPMLVLFTPAMWRRRIK